MRARALLLCAAGAAAALRDGDVCSPSATGFTDPAAQAIVCYTGRFLTEMLGELNRGPALGWSRKTQQHVRYRLLPYLGGTGVISALRTDNATLGGCRDANCTSCLGEYPPASVNGIADDLTRIRNTVPAVQLAAYDAARVCAQRLADAVMDALPKSADGVYLVPAEPAALPSAQTAALFRRVFAAPGGAAAYVACDEPAKVPAQPGDNCDGGAGRWSWVNACDASDHGFSDPTEDAMFCFLASFIQWCMYELTGCPALGCCRKTEQHVRLHLTPYLGGHAVTDAIKTDDPANPNCTACYLDPICADHQSSWFDSPRAATELPVGFAPDDAAGFNRSRDVFFSLNVCYVPMTNYIMEALPKDPTGRWLVPTSTVGEDPRTFTVKMLKSMIADVGLRACGATLSGRSR